MLPVFNDLAAVLRGLDQYRAGMPMREIQKNIAYPAIWMWGFAPTGIGAAQTVAVGVIVCLAATASTVLFLGKLTISEGIAAAILLVSPSFMLGVERCNVDLVVFLIVISAAWLLGQRAVPLVWPACLILFAAFLKLYPIAAATALIKKQSGWRVLIVCVTCFATYCLLIKNQIKLIQNQQFRDIFYSFGCMVPFDRLYFLQQRGVIERRWFELSGLAAALLIAGVAVAFTSRPRVAATLTAGVTGTGFLAGASIYILVFLMGNHYSYRFRWLILVVPQLFFWIREKGAGYRRALAALAALLCTVYTTNFGYGEVQSRFAFVLDSFNWILFAALVSLLYGVLLDDVRSLISKFRAREPASAFVLETRAPI